MGNMLLNAMNKTRGDYTHFDGVCGISAIFSVAILPLMGQEKRRKREENQLCRSAVSLGLVLCLLCGSQHSSKPFLFLSFIFLLEDNCFIMLC